jgi:hypothetical protein
VIENFCIHIQVEHHQHVIGFDLNNTLLVGIGADGTTLVGTGFVGV